LSVRTMYCPPADVTEVTKMDMRVENGKVTAFRTRVALSFKYES
jgi:flavin-binding protein dodecin